MLVAAAYRAFSLKNAVDLCPDEWHISITSRINCDGVIRKGCPDFFCTPGSRRLQFLGTDVRTEFVFEFDLRRKGHCGENGRLGGRGLNHCACDRDKRTDAPSVVPKKLVMDAGKVH